MKHKKKHPKSPFNQASALMTIPFVMVLPPILSWFIATQIQQFFALGPHIVYISLFLGLLAGFRETYRLIQTYSKD